MNKLLNINTLNKQNNSNKYIKIKDYLVWRRNYKYL